MSPDNLQDLDAAALAFTIERSATLNYLNTFIAHMQGESGDHLKALQGAMLQTLRVMHRNIQAGKHMQLWNATHANLDAAE